MTAAPIMGAPTPAHLARAAAVAADVAAFKAAGGCVAHVPAGVSGRADARAAKTLPPHLRGQFARRRTWDHAAAEAWREALRLLAPLRLGNRRAWAAAWLCQQAGLPRRSVARTAGVDHNTVRYWVAKVDGFGREEATARMVARLRRLVAAVRVAW